MIDLPEPYHRSVSFDDDEEPLNCWRGMPVRLDPWGRMHPVDVLPFGRRGVSSINTKGGLLVLTNQQLRHYIWVGDKGIVLASAEPVRPYVGVPLRSILAVAAQKGLASRILEVRARGTVWVPSSNGPLIPQDQDGVLYFDLDYGTDLRAVVDQIQAVASRSAGSPPSGGSPDPRLASSSPSGGGGGGADSFIHFHAESDEEEP